jgi:hypothetical protein
MSEVAAAPVGQSAPQAQPNTQGTPQNQTNGSQPGSNTPPPEWKAPATREEYLKQARQDILNESEERVINGKRIAKTRSEWLQEAQRLSGLNSVHQKTISDLNSTKAEREALAKALESGDALFDRLLQTPAGIKALVDAHKKAQDVANMTPEQRAQWEKTRKLEEDSRQLEEMRRADEERAEDARVEADAVRIVDGLEDGYKKIGWYPPEHVEPLADLIATELIDEIRAGRMESMTYGQLARQTHDILHSVGESFVRELDDAKLTEFLGEERVQKLVNAQVAKLQSGRPQVVAPQQQSQNRNPDNGQYAQRPKITTYSPGTGAFRNILNGR